MIALELDAVKRRRPPTHQFVVRRDGLEPSDPADGYGSMQVHNHQAKQTLFALNHWREGNHADIGIGSQPTGNPDWTFAGNAGSYEAKRLRVLVRLK